MKELNQVYIVLSDSGGGHRTFAETLKSMIEERYPSYTVEFLKLSDICKASRIFHPVRSEWIDYLFNHSPKFLIPVAQQFSKFFFSRYLNLFSRWAGKYLAHYWKKKKPAFVISVYPLFNKVLFESLKIYDKSIPFLTVIADFGEMHEKAWIIEQKQYYICPTENLHASLMRLDIPKENVCKTTGFLLPPNFYLNHYKEKHHIRKDLGLDEHLPTIIVVSGAYGSMQQQMIFHRLRHLKKQYQLIFITGKNRKIPAYIKSANSHHKVIAIPFTHELEKYLGASDLLIGKPGPNIVTQAISQQVPVIVSSNHCTMYQERYVADWVKKNEVGVVLKHFYKIDREVAHLFDSGKIYTLTENTSKQKNNAYNETAAFIGKILTRQESTEELRDVV